MSGRIISSEEAANLRLSATEGPWWPHGSQPYVMHQKGRGPSPVAETLDVMPECGDAWLIAGAPDLAYTVEQQGQQIAAVLALHVGEHWCEDREKPVAGESRLATWYCRSEPCPTARALGVTDQTEPMPSRCTACDAISGHQEWCPVEYPLPEPTSDRHAPTGAVLVRNADECSPDCPRGQG